MINPFVYGEVVPAAAFVDRRGRARPPDRRPRGRPEGLPDLAAPLRQVVARPPARSTRSARQRRADRRGHGQQLQLATWPSSRATRAALLSARDPLGPRARLDPRGARRGPARAPATTSGPPGGAAWRVAFPSARDARDVVAAGRRKCSRCRGRSPRPRGAPARDRARRVPGDRRPSTAAASSRRCAPRCSTSARSATCSPARSRR